MTWRQLAKRTAFVLWLMTLWRLDHYLRVRHQERVALRADREPKRATLAGELRAGCDPVVRQMRAKHALDRWGRTGTQTRPPAKKNLVAMSSLLDDTPSFPASRVGLGRCRRCAAFLADARIETRREIPMRGGIHVLFWADCPDCRKRNYRDFGLYDPLSARDHWTADHFRRWLQLKTQLPGAG